MALGIGSTLGGITGFLKSGIHVAVWDTVFDFFKDQAKEQVGKGAANIFKSGAKWGGLDRSDDRLLAMFYVALHKHWPSEYDGLREALDALWADMLILPDNLDNPAGLKTGKWAKRWRMTFIGLELAADATISSGNRKLKEKIPMIYKGQSVLGPDKKPLYTEKYEDGTEHLACSKDDPRVKHLYLIAKMAREELDKPLQRVDARFPAVRLPVTINHLMVTYLQDDPFFKLMGEKWRAVIRWAEGRNPFVQAQTLLWLTSEERERINTIAGLSEAEKTELCKMLVRDRKGLFQDDLRKIKEEPFLRGLLRFWWLLAIIAALIALPFVLPAQ